jgi:hypothetical protein
MFDIHSTTDNSSLLTLTHFHHQPPLPIRLPHPQRKGTITLTSGGSGVVVPVVRFILFHYIIFDTKYFTTENLSSDCHPHHDGSNPDVTKCGLAIDTLNYSALTIDEAEMGGNQEKELEQYGCTW